MKGKALFQKSEKGTGGNLVKLSPAVDLQASIQGWKIVSVSLGYDGKAYMLLIDEPPERQNGFVKSELAKAPCYKVLVADLRGGRGDAEGPDRTEEIRIEGETFNYHYVQPLGDELLLVGARSRYYGHDRYDRNAAVFDRGGAEQRRFLVGDGIQNVQTTAGGLIWTSFFDEGVFGNYGWDRPVGESGLIAWDRDGIRVFTNSEADIADCYALNVVSDEEVWFYYYTDFKLCRLSGPAAQPKVSFFDPRLSGSSVLATDGYRFLMDQGYDKHERYSLLHLDPRGRLVPDGELLLTDENGEPLGTHLRDARGDTLLFMKGTQLYCTILSDLF